MLSSGYFRYRWSYYRPIFERGEDPGALCRVNVAELPLRMAGEDAREHIPYALHPELSTSISTAIRRLHDYMERYVIRGEKVSAHQLPVPDAISRAMMQHLRAIYPHLPAQLLHHWCADPYGGIALYSVLQGVWEQSWGQERKDRAPWGMAVNILLLRVLRTTIAQLPGTGSGKGDSVVASVIGGAYLWSLQRFLEKNAEHTEEAERVPRHEALVVPATPIAFFYQQEDELFVDAPHLALSYGLDPDLAPRMRNVMRTSPGLTGQEMLARLSTDRLGDHMLKRSWARLCLWDLAASSGQGSWMKWALDGKRLDQLLSRTKELGDVLGSALESLRGHPFADWLLAQMQGDRKADRMTPWRQDLRTLMAFRVFDADIHVETARRKAERIWLDRYDAIVGKGRGDEASRALDGAFHAGKIVLLQPDFEQSLYAGGETSGQQACLRVSWADYLGAINALQDDGMQEFMSGTFMPGTLKLLEGMEGVFLDEYGASGCLLRGAPFALLRAGMSMRRLLYNWCADMQKSGMGNDGIPMLPMCLTLAGGWSVAAFEHKRFGKLRMAYAPALGQAMLGVAHGVDVPPADGRGGSRPLGGVRCPGAGAAPDNRGFAIAGEALRALVADASGDARTFEYSVGHREAQAVLPGYALPEGDFHVVSIQAGDGKEDITVLIVRVGKTSLSGEETDLFEVLETDAAAARSVLADGLPKWDAQTRP